MRDPASTGSRSRETGRNPVVLVHGLKDDARKMEPLARYLRAEGWTAHTLTVAPSWGQIGLDALAGQLAAYIDRTLPSGRVFDLVGFSMGGLIGRYYLQRLGGLARVERFVSISAPHRGSLLAWLLPNAGGRQMRPGSPFLRDLASDVQRLAEIEFTNLWTPFDAIIVPAWSSVLPTGNCRRIWCALHPMMVWQKRCLHAVAEALRAG